MDKLNFIHKRYQNYCCHFYANYVTSDMNKYL